MISFPNILSYMMFRYIQYITNALVIHLSIQVTSGTFYVLHATTATRTARVGVASVSPDIALDPNQYFKLDDKIRAPVVLHILPASPAAFNRTAEPRFSQTHISIVGRSTLSAFK